MEGESKNGFGTTRDNDGIKKEKDGKNGGKEERNQVHTGYELSSYEKKTVNEFITNCRDEKTH